jgi:hypothetical protein
MVAESSPLARRRATLRRELGEEIARGADRVWSEERFNELALAVFRYQADANRVYGAFVRNRGIEPGEVTRWRDVPAVPTRAFKEVPLACAATEPPEAVFRTSGTSLGGEARGEHPVRDLSLYHASLLETARVYLRPERDPRPWQRIIALLPAPADRPESSLVAMVGALADAWCDGHGGFFAGPDWELRMAPLAASLARAAEEDVPVLVVGTAFAFVHWLDGTGAARFPLPEGSVLMETGGFKGRSRRVAREELYEALGERFALPASRMVNEYGMTELLSQFYEPVLHEAGAAAIADRWHVGPPWIRTQVLDPATLDPVGPGEQGLLAHFDLANLDSVSAILTEDVGTAMRGGFRLFGRVAGAEPRGCSLSMEDLVAARGTVA